MIETRLVEEIYPPKKVESFSLVALPPFQILLSKSGKMQIALNPFPASLAKGVNVLFDGTPLLVGKIFLQKSEKLIPHVSNFNGEL